MVMPSDQSPAEQLASALRHLDEVHGGPREIKMVVVVHDGKRHQMPCFGVPYKQKKLKEVAK